MKKNFKLFKIGIFLALILGFALGQDAYGETFTSVQTGPWNDPATWGGAPVGTDVDGIPDADDIVNIDANHTVTLTADAICQSLVFADPNAGGSNSLTANTTVNLVVLGNIDLGTNGGGNTASITNGTGAVNLVIGDTTNASSSTVSVIDIESTHSITVNNVTLYNAAVTYDVDVAASAITILGNLDLQGTSTLTPGGTAAVTITFDGTGSSAASITVSDDSYLDFESFATANSAAITTTDDITFSGDIDIASGSFNQTAGTSYLVGSAAADPEITGGSISFYNLNVNTTAEAVTCDATALVVKGDLTKVGANAMTLADAITFTNTSAKEIVASGAGALAFENINISSNSRITTNSSFRIGDGTSGSTFTIGNGGSFNAATGTITLDGTGGNVVLVNSGGQDTCLTFANITFVTATTTTTATDLVITGSFDDGGATFTATAGKVVFDNAVSKSITSTGTTTFCVLEVADGSKVTCASPIVIADAGADQASGITVGTDGSLVFSTPSVVTLSDTDSATDMLINNDGTLTFFGLTIADNVANDIVTTDDFNVTDTWTFAGDGTFAASGTSNISFTGTGAQNITGADAPSQLILNDMTIETGALVTLAATNFLELTGDLTINGTGTFTHATNVAGTVEFNGTSQQKIKGSSASAVAMSQLVVDKLNAPNGTIGTEDEVLMELDVTVPAATGAVTITNGRLNLGSKTLTTGVAPTTPAGYIDGNLGTFASSTAAITIDNTLFSADNSSTSGTLYNLEVGTGAVVTITATSKLTVNKDLTLDDNLTFTNSTLHLFGEVTLVTGDEELVYTSGTAATSLVIFDGTRTVPVLQNSLFNDGADNEVSSIEIRANEILAGDVSMEKDGNGAVLTMNSSINNLNLAGNTLTLVADGSVNIVSGQMLANATSSAVDFGTITQIPANMFVDDEIEDITIAADITLLGNLTINGLLTTAPNSIYTGDNILTFGPDYTQSNPFTTAKHVIGRLRKTVTNGATLFELGDGTATTYRAAEITFSNTNTSQVVEVSSELVNATVDRQGDPVKALNAVWTITPIGTVSNTFDSVNVKFYWGTEHDNGLTFAVPGDATDETTVTTFPVRWDGSQWEDYSQSVVLGTPYAAGPPKSLDMTGWNTYPLTATDFGGVWSVFVDAHPYDDALEASTDGNLVFSSFPEYIENGIPFNATVQYQDQYGNPITVGSTDGAFTVEVKKLAGDGNITLSGTTVSAVIPIGSSSVAISGLVMDDATIATFTDRNNIQLKVQAASPGNYTDVRTGTSEVFNMLATEPAAQANSLTFANLGYTSMTVGFTGNGSASDKALIIAKPGRKMDSDEFPVDGTSYIGNNVFGAGSVIGDSAVVVYNGPANGAGNYSFSLSGLAPGETYYFRAFAYAGANGSENYFYNPGPQSALSKTTTSETDDDVAFGSNDTRATAKPIGSNSAVKGTIADATDEDWFSFMVTSAASNIRVKLTGVPANYNLELYNADNRRVRRATLSGIESEYVVINNLDAGTYSIRIYGVDGAYDNTLTYTVEVQTRDTEIFSVTQ